MKKFIVLMIFIIGSKTSQAALYDRGGGLIYDSEQNLTWLKDANYLKTSGNDSDGLTTWEEAISRVNNLVYYDSVREKTLIDWRLPSTSPSAGIGSITNENELGQLFLALLTEANPFENIQSIYWTNTWTAPGYGQYFESGGPFWVNFDYGGQDVGLIFEASVWAVQDGDVTTVPLPSTFWIFTYGLSFIALKNRQNKIGRR
jgi:hypothetical protein